MNQAFSSQAAAASQQALAVRGSRSLRQRVFAGVRWSAFGYGASQLLRLGSSLVLTRLLFAEAFGLMAIVTIVTQALEVFSDAGLRGSIIYNRRGDDPRFLNTAWTIQAIRGVIIWAAAIALAWPVARIYNEPVLAPMLMVVGASAVLAGLKSTKLVTFNRHIRVGRLTLLELTAQVLGVLITVAAAWWLQSVWALVIGAVARVAIYAAASHVMLPGPINRFDWCPDAARSLWRYGRWVLLASGIGFLAGHGDVLLLGLFMPMDWLGIYAIAFLLSQSAVTGVQYLSNRVLFPMYAESLREQPEALAQRLYRVRLGLMALVLPAMWALMLLGQPIVTLLYDSRFEPAGWMLQILAAGAVVRVMSATVSPVLLAAGDSYRMMILHIVRASVMVGAILVAGSFLDVVGLVVAVALAPWISYLMLARMVHGYGVWFWSHDLAATLGTAMVAILAWWLTG